MIQIGEGLFDRDSIIAVLPQADPRQVSVCVKWGRIFRVTVPEGVDLREQLLRGGLIAPEEASPLLADELTPEETVELSEALANGFCWLAQDKDGKTYAYVGQPYRGDAMWMSDDDPVRLSGSYDFLDWEDPEPVEIGALLDGEV